MAVQPSCAVHLLLLLLLIPGCRGRLAVVEATAPDAEVMEARRFAREVAEKMPLWDADAVAVYESAEIAAVKADVMATLREDDRDGVLEDAAQLHEDWDALVALDEMLKHEGLI